MYDNLSMQLRHLGFQLLRVFMYVDIGGSVIVSVPDDLLQVIGTNARVCGQACERVASAVRSKVLFVLKDKALRGRFSRLGLNHAEIDKRGVEVSIAEMC